LASGGVACAGRAGSSTAIASTAHRTGAASTVISGDKVTRNGPRDAGRARGRLRHPCQRRRLRRRSSVHCRCCRRRPCRPCRHRASRRWCRRLPHRRHCRRASRSRGSNRHRLGCANGCSRGQLARIATCPATAAHVQNIRSHLIGAPPPPQHSMTQFTMNGTTS
jgi:hypothetical protein